MKKSEENFFKLATRKPPAVFKKKLLMYSRQLEKEEKSTMANSG